MPNLDPRRGDSSSPSWLSKYRRKAIARVERRVGLDGLIKMDERHLARCQRRWGNESPQATLAMEHLATHLRQAGRLDEALILQAGALAKRSRFQGADESVTVGAEMRLAVLLARAKRYEEAEPLFARVVEATTDLEGKQAGRLRAMVWLGDTRRRLGKYDEAVPVLQQAVAGYRERLGEDDRATLNATFDLATVLALRRDFEVALPLQRHVVESFTRTVGPNDPDTGRALGHLATWLHWAGEDAEARLLVLTLLQPGRRLGADQDAGTKAAMDLLAEIDGGAAGEGA